MSGSASVVSPTQTPFENFDGHADGMFTPVRGSGARNDPNLNPLASSVFDTPPTPTDNGATSSSGLRERRLSRPELASSPRAGPLQLVIPPSAPHGGDAAATSPYSQVLAGLGWPGAGDEERADLEEVEREGQVIFENFIQQEVTAAGLTPPANFTPVGTAAAVQATPSVMNIPSGGGEGGSGQIVNASSHVASGDLHDSWFEHGRRLKMIADEFENSKERKAVLEQANTVDLNSITRERFTSLLSGLFPDSRVTLEGIVTLFVFCRDLAVRLLAENLPAYFCDMMRWAVTFITQNLCRWVFARGGWGPALSTGLATITAWNTGATLKSVLTVAVLAMIGFFIFRKSQP